MGKGDFFMDLIEVIYQHALELESEFETPETKKASDAFQDKYVTPMIEHDYAAASELEELCNEVVFGRQRAAFHAGFRLGAEFILDVMKGGGAK
jgi:hypothetical protein